MPDTTPFMSTLMEIETDWIDYNDHLNMGYYTVLFDRAADQIYERFGFGPDYIAATNHTTFTADFHVRYLRELKLGDRVRSSFWIVDHDEKRFHSFQELYHEDGWLAATGEAMTLHVDLSGPKVAPMPPAILSGIRELDAAGARLPRPEGIGAGIGIRRKG